MSQATHVPLTTGHDDHHDHHSHHHHHPAPTQVVHQVHQVHHVHDAPCCGPLVTGILWGILAALDMLFRVPLLSAGLYTVPEGISLVIDAVLLITLCVCGIIAHTPNVKAAKRYRLVIIIYGAKCAINVLLQFVLIATHEATTSDVTLPPNWEASLETISYGSVIFVALISAIIVLSCYSCASAHLRFVSNFDVEMGDLAQQGAPQVVQVAPMPVPMTMVPVPVYAAVPPPMPHLAPGPALPYTVPAELTAMPPIPTGPAPTPAAATPTAIPSTMPLLAPEEFIEPPPMRAIKAPSSAVDDSFDPRG